MTERYDEKKLEAANRPKAKYYYFVTGRGTFPFDMLRYDTCWPLDPESVERLGRDPTDLESLMEERSIHIQSYAPPTIERWSSFHWSVGKEKLR